MATDACNPARSPGGGEDRPLELLIVDDSADDADLMALTLQRGGIEPNCTRVASEKTLDAMLQRHWDLALLDYQMPGFDGRRALDMLLGQDRDLPVIVVSGKIGEEIAVELMRAGARDYVMKDRLGRLCPVVRRELAESAQRQARRLAEAALRLSEQRFRELAENVDEVFWLAAPDWSCSYYVSPAFYAIWGWSSQDAAGGEPPRPWADAVHTHDWPMVESCLQQDPSAIGDHVEFPEFRIVRPIGHVRWVRTRAFPVRDKQGRVLRFAGTTMDVTTRRSAEESLLRSNRALRALSACNQALVRVEEEAEFIAEVCHIVVDISGYRAAWVELLQGGKPDFRRTLAAAASQADDNYLQQVRERLNGQPAMAEVQEAGRLQILRDLALGGALPAATALLLPLRLGEEILGMLCIVSSAPGSFGGHELTLLGDLADDLAYGINTLRTREAHSQLQAQLQQARKMEAVGQLSGGIAHDFNNMLSSILGYAGLALERKDELEDGELEDYLSEVVRAGERARDLVSQMLTFSRAQQGGAVRIELLPMIKEAVKMLRFTLPASIELSVDPGEAGLAVRMDPVKLHQVLMNLSINARDAMQNKGSLHIAVQRRSLPAGELTCSACQEPLAAGDYVELSVEDSGSGMDAELLQRVFDPFFTTKEVGKGTGMGLSVVHGIVHEMGGHIRVESTLGGGSTFRLLLPVAHAVDPQLVEADAFSEEDAHYISGSAHILVVDDEQAVAGFLKELLTVSGYRVSLCHDGIEALEVFEREGDIDLVITDQTMPKLTGAELAGRLLQRSPTLPIILCTGYSEEVDEGRARQLGIRGYMHKPVASRTLLGKIDELLTLSSHR